MLKQLSLASRLGLLIGAVLLFAIVTIVANLSLWIASQSDIDQRNNALLIAEQISRLIERNVAERGELPAPGALQELLHLRWVRDVDILRISVIATDDTILADTEQSNVGKRAAMDWSLSDRPQRIRLTTDIRGQRTYLVPLVVPGRGVVCGLVIQLNAAAYRGDLYLAYEPMLRLGIPLLIAALACVVIASVLASKQIIRAALRALDEPTLEQPGREREPPDRHVSPGYRLESPEIRTTRQRLEAAASKLQDLASR